MEFSECRTYQLLPIHLHLLISFLVDVASREQDPHRRIAFVAAFAMSNYSSTIGRIAKPFNPMLVCISIPSLPTLSQDQIQSETFEYVHLDKEYRYVSEQVSHHPPISACWAESPLWHYFGEVRSLVSFRSKPTHCSLVG